MRLLPERHADGGQQPAGAQAQAQRGRHRRGHHQSLPLRHLPACEGGHPGCGRAMSAVLSRRGLLLASVFTGGAWLLGEPRAQTAAAPATAAPGFSHWLRFAPDGSLTLFSNTADIGQGTRAVIAQIAAEELALPMERIRVETAP